MSQRKDIDYGKDMPPKLAWSKWKAETQTALAAVMTGRMRFEAPREEEAAPAN